MSKPYLSKKHISKSPRALAIHLLIQCEQGAFSNDIVPAALGGSNFSDSDRAMITNIVYSTLRNQIRIDNALAKLISKPISKLDDLVINALRSVASQITQDFKAHAVLNETVDVMPPSVKGFVNAVSRKIVDLYKQNRFFTNEAENIEASLPEWIFDELNNVFENPKEVASSFNEAAYVTLAPFKDELDIAGSIVGDLVPTSRLIRASGAIGNIDEVSDGDAIVVDQGSQIVSHCVDATNDDFVLDLCCAPGGKSFLLSSRAKYVVSSDVSESRMRKFSQTKERLNVENVFPIVSDATAKVFTQGFNHILIDAPCSGLGVLKRRPDSRLRIQKENVDELVILQKEILKSAIGLLGTGAKLIYSVCTFTQKETIDIDNWLKETYPELIAEDLSKVNSHLAPLGRGYLLAPGIQNDGMYVLRLVKS